ncbi:hypothetical protein [Metallibacterium sp.]
MPKFDETDRSKVISEVERHLGTKLSRVGNYRKFLQDASGKSYWVLGGYEDWHGITSDMLKKEQRRATDGVLVVAKRHKSTIDIFSGPLQPLIANYRDLSHTQTGDYQFNVAIRGNSMTIKEVQGLTLRKLGASQEVGTAVSPQLREATAILAKMSPEERSRLLEQLSGKSGG